jgi:hypothetical protein
MLTGKKLTGKKLNKLYKMGLRHARYGCWYHLLEEFPAAYFDDQGCIRFETEQEFLNCDYLGIAGTVYVKGPRFTSISSIPGYQRLQPPPASFKR